VSACLPGEHVRYDGRSVVVDSPILRRWVEQGLPVPREFTTGAEAVLALARVFSENELEQADRRLEGRARRGSAATCGRS
jgi:uncharacterized protein YbbK (DUF523 family)